VTNLDSQVGYWNSTGTANGHPALATQMLASKPSPAG
jgi:hypothetical protein